jgi:uncharacterized protein (TIGR02145 family)
MKTKNRIWIWNLIVIGLILILTNSCSKQKDQGQSPVLITRTVSSIKPTTVNCGGNITSDGGATITARGVCWSTAQNPTIADSKTTDGTGTGTFKSVITGLTATTTYYVKAYATNSAGTGYGDEMSFKTYTGEISDADGNIYNTMSIGTQTWMVENLKTTKYLNGDLIGTTSSPSMDITSESTPKFQWAYAGDPTNVDAYGRLYTWYAIMDARKVCPAGWHVPSDPEWKVMIDFLGGEGSAGGKLKEIGLTYWQSPNAEATNETGFGALPGGYRGIDGTYGSIHLYSNWWSTKEGALIRDAYRWGVESVSAYAFGAFYSKHYGFSVRCLMN